MIDTSESLVREVNEAMRQERLQGFLRLFGKYIIALSVLVLLATVGYVWWQNNKTAQYQQISGKFFEAMELIENGKSIQAKPIIDGLAKNPDEQFALIAQMWQIKLKYLSDKPLEANVIAEQIMKNTSGKKNLAPYHDLAQLHVNANVENKTYRLSALEIQAAKHVEAGEMQPAQQLLQRIAQDAEAPQTMRERAEKMLSIIK